jgi:hypothetical protein
MTTASVSGGMAAWQDQGGRAPPAPMMNGNTVWAQQYADEIRDLIYRQAARAPRSIQAHLGPSELGVECDRQVVGKMIAAVPTNHVSDPWPAIIGTAVHAWLAQAFQDENARIGLIRFLTELSVAPVPEHPGTTDLYDGIEQATVDHKVLGPTSMAKIQSPDGPPRHYLVQLLLYWLGCQVAGLPSKRIVLIAYPRTEASLDRMYVWERQPGPADVALLQEVLRVTAVRRQIAARILEGRMHLSEVPITPDEDVCYFCPFWRPQAAYDGGPGCPGKTLTR